MNNIHVAGVLRSNEFSPNHIGNDAAIFQATVEHLEHHGCHVAVYSEQEFVEQPIDASVIFSMARSEQAIAKLLELEKQGVCVTNSPQGVMNCTREMMTRLLLAQNIPHPRSLILSTSASIDDKMQEPHWFPCWVKRGDFHAIHREDVTFVRNKEEAKQILQEFKLRGIPSVVINEHLRGDLVKFYGVDSTPFFHWFYPFDVHHSKFGLEQINGLAKGYTFNQDRLKSICDQAAMALGVKVYGGDCIVSEDGDIQLIDFNDWPSFAPCRQEASTHIAHVIYKEVANFLIHQENKTCHHSTIKTR